jgi:hypothetical protein
MCVPYCVCQVLPSRLLYTAEEFKAAQLQQQQLEKEAQQEREEALGKACVEAAR